MQQKLSQEQLAAKAQLLGCDLTRSALAKIECGQQSIYPDELKALHLALNVPCDTVLSSAFSAMKKLFLKLHGGEAAMNMVY